MLSDLGDEPVGALDLGPEDDERADELASALEIARADDACVHDDVVAAQRVLDVGRAEAVSAARDHVLRPPEEMDVAVLVAGRDVSGHVHVAAVRGLRLVGRLPVAGEEHRRLAANDQISVGARR